MPFHSETREETFSNNMKLCKNEFVDIWIKTTIRWENQIRKLNHVATQHHLLETWHFAKTIIKIR